MAEAGAGGWNLRRGFLRLCLLFWMFGAALLVWLNDEPLLTPLAKVCVVEQQPVYAECLTKSAREAAGAHLGRRLLARIDGTWEQIDTTRPTRRFETGQYREELKGLALWQLFWALCVWGLFYVFLWIASGFRRGD